MMEDRELFSLGLGLREPWEVVSQHLDTEKKPHELYPHSNVKCTTSFAKDFIRRSIVQTLPWTMV